MHFALGALVLIFNLLDNLTTFLCLRAPVEGYEVVEANPIARFLFASVGLVEGLVFEMAVTSLAIAFLVWTERIPRRVKLSLLTVLAILPAWAVTNNLLVMRAISIGWLG